MFTVTQALKELNRWSDWDTGTPSMAALSRDGEGPPPSSGDPWGFAVPRQHHSSPQVPMGCPEPSDVGLPAQGQSRALTLDLKLKMHWCLGGSRQQRLLHAAVHITARLGLVPPRCLHLLLAEVTAPARLVMSCCLHLLKPPRQTIFFSESGAFFFCLTL